MTLCFIYSIFCPVNSVFKASIVLRFTALKELFNTKIVKIKFLMAHLLKSKKIPVIILKC